MSSSFGSSGTLRGSQGSRPHKPTQQDIEKRPWQYKGYPAFTAWMGSSSDFFLLRRFDKLNAWVQLDWQDQIARLETKLEQVNEQCRQNSDVDARSDSLRPDIDPMPRRQEIIKELRSLLKEYNEFILSYSQMRARSTAEDFQVKNVENWFWNNDQAVNEAEQDFVTHRSELIPLTERKKPILRRIIEHLGADRLARMFPARHRTGRVECETTTYSSNRAIDAVMAILIVGLGVTILLGPMWWLNFVTNITKRLGIITAFVVLFALILTGTTVQKPFEVLVGTAVYAAVLVVFVQQNVPGSGADRL